MEFFFLTKSPITVNIWTAGKPDGSVSPEMTVSLYGWPSVENQKT